MGGGGLRLLPHKSWNVWNYDNRKTVERDEAQAKVDEEERRRRADAADQESRLTVLRKRARKREDDEDGGHAAVGFGNNSDTSDAESHTRALTHDRARSSGGASDHEEEYSYPALQPPPGDVDSTTNNVSNMRARSRVDDSNTHINFFADIERGLNKRNGKSAQKEEERKQEEIKQLKKIGALVYLGQTVTDAKSAPWYNSSASAHLVADDHSAQSKPPDNPRKRFRKSTISSDPLDAMKKYVGETGKTREIARQHAAKAQDARDERLRREQQAREQVKQLYSRPPTPLDAPETGYSNQQQYRQFIDTQKPNKSQRPHQSKWDVDPDGDRSHHHHKTKKSKKHKSKKDKKEKKSKKSKS
eukprot:m.188585 g.188585  ORF g.188585 m.188585 type:complete len:359 (+) comp32349_c2_seq5:309-1385(+)